MSTDKRRRRALAAAAFLLSAVSLWWALRQVNVHDLKLAFSSIRYAPAALCAGALFMGIVLRALRWRVIADRPRAEHWSFAYATNLGILANLLLPARAGEVVRVAALSALRRSPLHAALASALIDRLTDVGVLLLSVLAVLPLSPIAPVLRDRLYAVLAAGCAIVAVVVIVASRALRGEALISRIAARLVRGWPLRPEVFIAELRTEFRRLAGKWTKVEVLALALLILGMDYSAIASLLASFDLALPPAAPLLLWVCLAAGSALPSAPAYAGVYQVAAIWALSNFAVPPATSVALALVLQAVTLAVALAVAAAGWFRMRAVAPALAAALRRAHKRQGT